MLTFTTKRTGTNSRDVFVRETDNTEFVKIAENANGYEAVKAMQNKRNELNTTDSVFIPNLV